MSIKHWAKECVPIRMLYYGVKAVEIQRRKWALRPFLTAMKEHAAWTGRLPYPLRDRYHFQNRQKGQKKLCMILAGYKPDLWDSVFQRISRFLPEDIDVCVMTSGVERPKLMRLCEERGWSYLATRRNKLTRIQNLAIYLHPEAEYIYKLDEDMFITAGFFEGLYETYQRARRELSYEIAFAAPLIPVNGYGYVRILERCGLGEDWAQQFGSAVYTDGIHHHRAILEQAGAARYMWGETQPLLRDIDRLAQSLSQAAVPYTICPIRFSIGAILFSRAAWLDWGLFPVDWTVGMGLDEACIAHYCMFHGKAAIVSEITLAGHLAFGPQKDEMLKEFSEGRLNL